MDINIILSDIVTSIMQTIIAFILMTQAFPPKLNRKRNICYLMIASGACVAWLSLYAFVDINFPPNIAPVLLCCFLYARLSRKGTWSMHLLLLVLFTAATGAVTFGVLGALSLFWGVDAQGFMMDLNIRLPVTGIILLLYFPFVYLLIRVARRGRNDQELPVTTFVGMMVMPMLIISVLLLLINAQYDQTSTLMQSMPLLTALGLIIFNFIMIWLFDRMSKQAVETQLLRTEAYMSKIQVRYQQEMSATYQEIRSWRHDSHNQIQTMLALLQMGKLDELTEYMKTYANEYAFIDQLIASGNSMVDALLTAKKGLALKKNTTMDIQIRLPETLPLTDNDLCILLGNLIDNSLDACERIERGEDRFIKVDISLEDAHLRISIDNATNGHERRIGNAFLSIKGDSALHGLGLHTIDRIVSGHQGYCARTHSNAVFSTTILLPLRAIKRDSKGN